jgi:hypothetical protein
MAALVRTVQSDTIRSFARGLSIMRCVSMATWRRFHMPVVIDTTESERTIANPIPIRVPTLRFTIFISISSVKSAINQRRRKSLFSAANFSIDPVSVQDASRPISTGIREI